MVRPAIAQSVLSIGTTDSTALSTQRGSQPAPRRDILVIEDDPAAAGVLRLALQREGHTVEMAADGAEGLSCLQRRRYRLLLLDLLLPGVDGLGVLRALRQEPIWRPPVVIILSALPARANVVQALEAGADDYVPKPFEVTDLVLRVSLWLRRVVPAAPAGPPGLRIHSLGRFYVEHWGQIRLTEGGQARKAATLFKYLLTHQERTIPTSEVLTLLWPGVPRDLAATNLRSLLRQLRRQLGVSSQAPSLLEHTRTTVALHLGPTDWWDVAEFGAWVAEGARWQRAGATAQALRAFAAGAALYQGDYLAEDDGAGWVAARRAQLREDWLTALSALAELHGERGEHGDQETLLRTVLRVDPYREHSYRALMTLLAEQGRRAEALVLDQQLEELLRVQFGASPAPETQALASRLRGGAPAKLVRG
jgi:DNA-binding response OmpR family regulator